MSGYCPTCGNTQCVCAPANERTVTTLVTWSESTDASPRDVADALRRIADQIQAEELCLISIYNTGFGEEWEACLQVVVDDHGDDS